MRALLDEYKLISPFSSYALPRRGTNNQVIGIHTGAGNFVSKTYRTDRSLEAIRYEHHLLNWLASRQLSFALPVPCKTRDGGTIVHAVEGMISLSPLLPGQQLDPRNVAQVEAMGAALGELHIALADYHRDTHPGVPPLGELLVSHPLASDANLADRLETAVLEADASLWDWWREELAALVSFGQRTYRDLPFQTVHRDLDPSNTLVGSGRVTGVLDFEYAGEDARALDLAVSLKFTMRAWENQEPWEIARALGRGYRSWKSLSVQEVESVPWLMRLRDAASTLLRIRRVTATGDVQSIIERMEWVRKSARWLTANERRLIDLVGHEVGVATDF